jgi:hypothetical protein
MRPVPIAAVEARCNARYKDHSNQCRFWPLIGACPRDKPAGDEVPVGSQPVGVVTSPSNPTLYVALGFPTPSGPMVIVKIKN